jgi:protein TonB
MDLMTRGLQIARSNPDPNPGSTKAREKYINPKAMTTPERFYMEAWRRKVERVGTMNFPDEARRRNLTGKLILDVALLADGSVKDIRLVRSSGQPVLDDAAQRIVRLGAPYAQFPDALRRQFDVLHIVRTWEFLPGNTLRGK